MPENVAPINADSTDDGQGDGPIQIPLNDLRALRQAAKDRDDMAARLAEQERELAFAKAKIDMDDPRLKYFVKAYDGDLTPEAIRTQAEADGFFEPKQVRSEVVGQTRIAHASSGAGETPNPNLEERIKQAQSQEEVMAIMMEAGYPTSWSQ